MCLKRGITSYRISKRFIVIQKIVNINEKASIDDFTMLLDKLAEYYSIGFGKLNDLNARDN